MKTQNLINYLVPKSVMAFIRVKKIKNHHYAYLVENKWRKTKGSSKQKVKAYLGGVVNLEDNPFVLAEDISKLAFKAAIMLIAGRFLESQGFTIQGKKFVKDEYIVDLGSLSFKKNGPIYPI